MRTLPWLVSLGWRFRIEAMTNICDWIKEFCSYIKLWVSGASNKYSIWLQFEWLQCCSAQSPGIRSYLRCRELQWRRGRSVRGLLTPGLIIRCHSPGSDQWPWVMMSVACLTVSAVWRVQTSAGGPWPDLNSSALCCERLRLRHQAGGLSPIGWWGRSWLWPDSSLRSESQP